MTDTSTKDRPTEGSRIGESQQAKSAGAVARDRADNIARAIYKPETVFIATRAGGNRGRYIAIATFFVGVILPFILVAAYYGWYSTPQYLSEARFAVRTLGGDDIGTVGGGSADRPNLFSTTPLKQEAYVIKSFVHSPAILERLATRVDFNAVFGRDEIDYLSRLPRDSTREELAEYWENQVGTFLDGPSGILTLRVKAFTPEEARDVAKAIIQESENLANELSVRARQDYVERAEQEVATRQGDYRAALDRLNDLRNSTAILDPGASATETATLLTKLLGEKLDIDARLFVLEQQAATNSPTVRQLKREQEALEGQITVLRAGLADDQTADSNLSETIRRFSELDVERTLAAELYGAARRNLVMAQADAIRKAVYISVFVEPTLADDSQFPHRLATPLLFLLGFCVIWGIGLLLWASIEDHRT